MLDTFISAMHSKEKIRVTFFSKEDNTEVTRLCAPMDYGPSRRAHDKSNRYHFWDYDSDKKQHTLSLIPDQIINIEKLSDTFNPQEFVTWDTVKSSWFVKRDWGRYS